MPVLLVMSVGGTPNALAASIIQSRPERILFIPSPETRESVDDVLQLAKENGVALSPGQIDLILVPDSQDFHGCVEAIHDPLEREVTRWQARGSDFHIRVDITGGTKCMSAALALTTHRWPCEFVYVGGSQRNKGGVGIVVSGAEQVLYTQNPWDSLGYQAVQDAIALFNNGHYEAALQPLQEARAKAQRVEVKEEISALINFVHVYALWDSFQHQQALTHLDDVLKGANDLKHLMGVSADALLDGVRKHRRWLARVGNADDLNRWKVLDVLANACRRGQQGRYDDGVARLYRAIEGLAQVALKEQYGMPDTGKVPLVSVPSPLNERWAGRAKNGVLLLGLQEDYQLLLARGDDLGRRFQELGLEKERSPLTSRNHSILAHGFQSVSRDAFERLKTTAFALAQCSEGQLPQFPVLRRFA